MVETDLGLFGPRYDLRGGRISIMSRVSCTRQEYGTEEKYIKVRQYS